MPRVGLTKGACHSGLVMGRDIDPLSNFLLSEFFVFVTFVNLYQFCINKCLPVSPSPTACLFVYVLLCRRPCKPENVYAVEELFKELFVHFVEVTQGLIRPTRLIF